MAKFTRAQVDNAKDYTILRWNRKGGWDMVTRLTQTISEYILSEGIYNVTVKIDGTPHEFYSKGAKEYGIEYLV